MRLLPRGLPNLRGKRVPGRIAIAGIVALAFVVGVGAGWGSAIVAEILVRARPTESPSATPPASVTGLPIIDIPVDLYPELTRFMNPNDRIAGLINLDVPERGDGNFVVVPGTSEPIGTGPTRWVRIEIEDGVPIDPTVVTAYVMSVLNDSQGWTARGRVAFGRTDGVADIRIVFATPKVAQALCPRAHDPLTVLIAPPDVPSVPGGLTVSLAPTAASPSPSPTVGASPSPAKVPSCAEQGIVVVSAYQWASGIKAFGDDANAGHAYMINHPMGHLLGEPDATCGGADQLAPIMVDHELDITPCKPNGWPFPDNSDS
jgi:hypothetical protein